MILAHRIHDLENEIRELQLREPTSYLAVSTDNVSSPPTDAELTTAFGTRQDGFVGVLDDNGGGLAIRLIVRSNSNWYYSAVFTQAI